MGVHPGGLSLFIRKKIERLFCLLFGHKCLALVDFPDRFMCILLYKRCNFLSLGVLGLWKPVCTLQRRNNVFFLKSVCV